MSKKYIHKVPQRVQDGINKRIKKSCTQSFRRGKRRGNIDAFKTLLAHISELPLLERIKYLFTKKLI